ncbi:hypothetical protein SteCoe_16465 [Stentor coeruleus]|uniref:Thioredoxin-like fold domain-containing protein n=1 Tax=Stentor coeruleus TaxID=5963 RepID=A0A1R2C198_9CILI|nr:hypothetical protein SteCoe_16465 [Stentor coeruleus]
MSLNTYNIDLTPSFSVLSVRQMLTGKQVLIDFFSKNPLWVLCLNKNSLSLIKKFHGLNKNYHHSSFIVIFSNPEGIRKKIGAGGDKPDVYWVEKRYREDIYKALKIFQLPWVLSFEEGQPVYSGKDFPADLSELKPIEDFEQPQSPLQSENAKILTSLKEQVQILKSKTKKHETKEINYKSKITDLKNTINTLSSEITLLKKILKNNEIQPIMSPEPKFTYSKNIINQNITPRKPHFQSIDIPEDDNIWKSIENCSEKFSNLAEISVSKELWINNHDIKMPKIPVSKRSSKLNSISSPDKSKRKNSLSRDAINRVSPSIFKSNAKKILY